MTLCGWDADFDYFVACSWYNTPNGALDSNARYVRILPCELKRMVQTKQDVLAAIRDNQARIRAYGVKSLGLFGSFVRERHRAESDVDLLVEFEPGKKTFDNFMGLSFFLEELLQRPVELVTTDALSPHIGPHILQEAEYAPLSP